MGGTTEMESDEAAEAGVQPTGLTAALQPPPQLSSEVALARLLHPELRYTWQVTKNGNTVVAVGANALTDDLSGAVKYRIHERERAVGKGQLQGAIRALIAARGGTPPGSVTGSVEQLRVWTRVYHGDLHRCCFCNEAIKGAGCRRSKIIGDGCLCKC